MRFECDDPEFAGDFVEFTAVWTRREMRAFWEEQRTFAEHAALIIRKVTACKLGRFTNPKELTPEVIDGEMDMRLYAWLCSALFLAILEANKLGEAMRSRLYATSAVVTETKEKAKAHLN